MTIRVHHQGRADKAMTNLQRNRQGLSFREGQKFLCSREGRLGFATHVADAEQAIQDRKAIEGRNTFEARSRFRCLLKCTYSPVDN